MKKILIHAGIVFALALGVFATPSRADAVFNFSTNGTCSSGCGTATGSSGTLSGMTISDLNTLSVTIGSTVETWGVTAGSTLVYASGKWTFDGILSCTSASTCGSATTGGTTSTQLIQWASTGGTYVQIANGGNPYESFTLASATSINESATFINTLHLTGSEADTSPEIAGGSAKSVNNSTTSPYTLNSSQTVAFETQQVFATPEPVSLMLFGSGLLAIGLIARRRQGSRPAVVIQ